MKTKTSNKKLLKELNSKLLEFFVQYQKSLWLKNKDGTFQCQKDSSIIPIITKIDLLYYLQIDLTLSELEDLLLEDEKLKSKLNDFINNNYVHYCSSVKLKELMQEYKDNNISFEPNKFIVDYSDMQIFNVSDKKQEKQSLCLDLECDVDEQEQERILKDVELFN